MASILLDEFSQRYSLVVFDLDGVLVDSREAHFNLLNQALNEIAPDFEVTWEFHLAKLEGLDTRSKLNFLSSEFGLDIHLHEKIWTTKQNLTSLWLETLVPNPVVYEVMSAIKSEGISIAVASNSIKSTVSVALRQLGLEGLIDAFFSNEDVSHPKPYPEIYWKAMSHFGVLPSKTLIVEDSVTGRKAAYESGANLLPIKSPSQLSLNLFKSEGKKPMPNKIVWEDDDLLVVVPMAGAGSRFSEAGYVFPKPLIEVHGKPMIEKMVESLNIKAKFLFLVQSEHLKKYNLKETLGQIVDNPIIVEVDELTDGAARTVLLAEEYIDRPGPLLIANSDQIIEWDAPKTMFKFSSPGIDGGILTFESSHPKWSYAKTDSTGRVTEVAEKRAISNNATAGIYYWARGSDYVRCAKKMIEKDIRTNGEFYVCPVFNELIEDGGLVITDRVEKMWGLGTPEDLGYFIAAFNSNETRVP